VSPSQPGTVPRAPLLALTLQVLDHLQGPFKGSQMRYFISTPQGQIERRDRTAGRQSFYLFIVRNAPFDSWTPVAEALQGALRPSRLEAALVAFGAGIKMLNEVAPDAYTIAHEVFAREQHEGWQYRIGDCIISSFPTSMVADYKVQMIP
jgi:hypothetical protein